MLAKRRFDNDLVLMSLAPIDHQSCFDESCVEILRTLQYPIFYFRIVESVQCTFSEVDSLVLALVDS